VMLPQPNVQLIAVQFLLQTEDIPHTHFCKSMTITEWLIKKPESLLEMMNQIHGGSDIDFEPETVRLETQSVNFD
jgi:hypothetical protein